MNIICTNIDTTDKKKVCKLTKVDSQFDIVYVLYIIYGAGESAAAANVL